jgi:phosphomannomutase
MATFQKEIFRTYDIRGNYPGDFDSTFTQRLGGRVASWLGAGSIVVGRDARPTSDELGYAVLDGAVYAGANVIDVGVLSTPQFYWAVRSLGAAGGIMITASHNPHEQNGFKVVAARGQLLEVIGGDVLRQVYDGHVPESLGKGSVTYHDVAEGYAAAVSYAAKWQGGRELLMSVDGPGAVRDVLSRLGPIAPDHGLGVRFDTDGDRVAFFEDGVQIPPDSIFLLLAEQLNLKPLVFDLRFSRTVRQRLEARRIPYSISRVGRLALTTTMHATGAAFGGEVSGHFYWKEFGGMECPELTALRVYDIVRSSERCLSDLVAPYRVLVKSEEISLPIRDRKRAGAALKKLSEYYAAGKQDHTDGLTVEFEDWWCNVRPSNTESVLRMVVEANKKDLLDEKVREVEHLIR